MIVDFHTHIFPPKVRDNRASYLGRDRCFDLLYSNPRAKIATAEDLIASMDAEGIDVSVALNIGWASHRMCQETNDYIMESASRYPGRLVGFCAVQPSSVEEAVAEIDRCGRAGIRGIGELRPDTQGFDFGSKSVMDPVVQVARRHNMVILTHASEPVGHVYPGKGSVTPDILYRFVTNFPDAPVVLAHWGGGLPFYALMPEVAKSMTNVYFDTAASPFLYKNEIFKWVSELVGPGNILFGSDYPLIKQNRIVKVVQSLDLAENTKRLILGENACRLLSLH